MPRLVIQQGEGIGRDTALGAECVVGRHPSANFVLDDHLMSRRHFRIIGEGGVWVMEDLGSTNGTLVNGRRAKRQPLVDGDVIRAGTTLMVFVQKDLLGGATARPAQKPVPVKPKPPRAPTPPDAPEPPPKGTSGAPVPRRRRRR